jgi:pyruvate dehydrogenase E2 component (dihydrolipoamide acetyltransferase)
MATEIIMPKVDMVMETGTFVEWLKKEGDQVNKGEPLFVILTDKATIECESPDNGILSGITAKPDDVIPVTNIIGYILKPGEALPKPPVPTSTPSPEISKSPVNLSSQSADASITPKPVEQPTSTPTLLRATPLARTIAREKGLDLTSIRGRGPRGRIYKSDVLDSINQAGSTQAFSTQIQSSIPVSVPVISPQLPSSPVPGQLSAAPVKERIPLKGPRAIIAQRMAQSFSTIPHLNESVSVDMSEIVRLRGRISPVVEAETGNKVTYTTLIALAVAKILPDHSSLNSSLIGSEIVVWEDVNLGIATSLEDYLIVPVIRQAQKRDLKSMSAEMARLLDAARNKHLDPGDMSGSTFTLTNLGMFGIESFTAIINPPEAAILAIGKMLDQPVVVNNEVVIRPMMNLTIAADHRINDGAKVANFLMELKGILENPYLLL